MDDKGYVKINDNLYDNLGTDLNLGVSIQPRQVQIKRGVNLIEIRTINTGGGPTGVWLTITVNNNILVKTGCHGWKCTRFFYPAEVFHVGGYNKAFADAPSVCQKLGARVAKYSELDEAQKNGGNWCSTGWVSDMGDKNAFYPITYDITRGCGNGRSGVIDFIFDYRKAGVNCFGNKPEEEAGNKMVGRADEPLFAFNKNQWSRYSPGTSPPVVPPTLPPITIHEHCDGAGWYKELTGPKLFNSGADYPSDVSYIRVPAGVTVIISYNGRSFTIVGPRDFNACGGSGDSYFNDKISSIDVRATNPSDSASATTPPSAVPGNINIISASYGVNCGAPANNVTSRLQDIINRQADKTSFSFTGGIHTLFGDPAPNCGKSLRVIYDRGDGQTLTKDLPGVWGEYHSFSL
jgi:hypothetical protein